MPTPKKGPRLASSPAHERLMLANMATSLFQNGRITTTLPKAKRLRPLAERLITFAKRGDLHNSKIKKRIICRFCNKKAMKPSLFIVSMTFLCLCRDTWKRVLPMIKCFHPVFFQQNKNVLFLI